MIHVHKPKIEEDKEICRVSYEIEEKGRLKKLFFEFDKKWIWGMIDRGDHLLVMLFLYAMKVKEDLKFDMPITERLYYQVNTYLIDGLHQENKNYKKIKIYAERTSEDYQKEKEHKKVIGTGMSCGTDSLCTFYTHNYLNNCEDYKINILAYFNLGAFHYGDGKKNENQEGKCVYEEHKKIVQKFADEVKLPLFILNSNFAELFPMDHDMVDAMRNCGAVLMFQKMFDVYYYSSSYPLNDFYLNPEKGSGYYEIYTLPNISTNSLTFYSSNSTYNKLRKITAISKFAPSYKYLNVCTVKSTNCGQCSKCARTLMMLDAVGKVNKYAEVFDIEKYKKRKAMLMGYALASYKETHFKELVPILKKKRKLPFTSYFYYIIFCLTKPIERIMRKLPPEKRRMLVKFSEKYHIRVPF